MNPFHISPCIHFRFEDGRIVDFYYLKSRLSSKPTPEECSGKITGVCLDYAFCGEQDFGIDPLLSAFDAKNDQMIMKKTPIEVIKRNGVLAIKYGGNSYLTTKTVKLVKEFRVIGYWDDSSFIISVAPEYKQIISSLKEMLKPNQSQFAFGQAFGGRVNLLILKI